MFDLWSQGCGAGRRGMPGIGNARGSKRAFCGTGIDRDLLMALLCQAGCLRDGHAQKETSYKEQREKSRYSRGPDEGFFRVGKEKAHTFDLPFVSKDTGFVEALLRWETSENLASCEENVDIQALFLV